MITSLDGIVEAFQRKQIKTPAKYGAANSAVVGYWNSSWRMAGSYLAPAVPSTGSGDACDGTTPGRIPFDDPTSGRKLYLSRFLISASVAASAYIADRLVQTSGLSANISTLQNVNTVALPARAGNGEGVECWIECYSALGTSQAYTITYTNSAGVGGRVVTVQIPATLRITSMVKVPLLAGDLGVRSVQSVQLGATSGTVGNFGITLCKRITGIAQSVANVIAGSGVLDLGMPEIPSGSCLFFILTASVTSSPSFDAELTTIEG